MSPTVYILLPIHNRREVTRGLIECLSKQTYRNIKLIVIDDGSSDGSSEMIRGYFNDAVVIKGTGNWWWAGSLQQGFKWLKKNNAAKNDLVLIINDDSFVKEDYIQTAVAIMSESSNTLLLSEAYSLESGKLIDRGVVFDFKSFKSRMAERDEEINCMSTRGLFMFVGDFIKLRGFRNILLPHYYSDYEFTIRAKRKGFTLRSDEKLMLWMNESTTGITRVDNPRLIDHLKSYFSKRYTDHPGYTLNFILLTFPFPHNVKFALRHLKNTAVTMLKIIRDKSIK